MEFILRPVRLLGRVMLAGLAQSGRFSMMLLEIIRGLPEWRIWLPRTFTECVQHRRRQSLHHRHDLGVRRRA